MKKIYLGQKLYINAAVLLFSTSIHAGLPLWTYSAPNPASITIAPGSTATVTYTVTNQSKKSKNLLLKTTPGLSASSCTLATRGSTCVLTLTINGSAVATGGVHEGPIMCEQGNANQCYQPSFPNRLNITVSPTPSSSNMALLGLYVNGGVFLTSYYSTDNGKSWILSPGTPPNSSATQLGGISCNIIGECAMVSARQDGTPISYYSSDNGRNWTTSTTPPPIQGSNSLLTGVSCTLSGACAAVGYYDNGVQRVPLSYYSTDAGKTWLTSSTQPPAQGVNGQEVLGVSCAANGACAAVGQYDNGASDVPLTYYSTDGGNNWLVSSSLPATIGGTSYTLLSVSCISGGTCVTTGSYNNGAQRTPLSYYSNDAGTTWTISTTLPQALTSGQNELAGIYCTINGACSAVGVYNDGVNQVPLSYFSTDFGDNWAVSSTLPPPAAAGFPQILGSVFCTTGGACSAVGYAGTAPLSYYSTDYGQSWIASSVSPPSIGSFFTAAIAVS